MVVTRRRSGEEREGGRAQDQPGSSRREDCHLLRNDNGFIVPGTVGIDSLFCQGSSAGVAVNHRGKLGGGGGRGGGLVLVGDGNGADAALYGGEC